MHIDGREFPSENGCIIAICAGNDDESLEAAEQHAVAV